MPLLTPHVRAESATALGHPAFAARLSAARSMHMPVFMDSDRIERIANQVIGCGIEVHRTLGPGLLESVYQECLEVELHDRALRVEHGRRFPIQYKGRRLRTHLTVDLLVEGCVVVELKAIERIHPVHLAQVITYLKLSDSPVGLLMNFNSPSLRAGLKRLDHPDRYQKRSFTSFLSFLSWALLPSALIALCLCSFFLILLIF